LLKSNNGNGSSNNFQSAAGALPIRIAGSMGIIIRDTTGQLKSTYSLTIPRLKTGGLLVKTLFLIAQLYDTSGINATGNGIGHDIVLVKNNDDRNSIILNSFFSNDLNQYQRGDNQVSTAYPSRREIPTQIKSMGHGE
jgi:hypothetical protein